MAKAKKSEPPAPIKHTHYIVLQVDKDSSDPILSDAELKKWATDMTAGADYGNVTVISVSDQNPLTVEEDDESDDDDDDDTDEVEGESDDDESDEDEEDDEAD